MRVEVRMVDHTLLESVCVCVCVCVSARVCVEKERGLLVILVTSH